MKKEIRCTKCKNPFETHHKKHNIEGKTYHTGCVPRTVEEMEKEIERKRQVSDMWKEMYFDRINYTKEIKIKYHIIIALMALPVVFTIICILKSI